MLEHGLVVVHVVVACVALVTGPLAMVTRKGGVAHRRWGNIYFWSMLLVFVSALGLLLFRPNFFLLMVSILSFYAAFSGYRVLSRRRRANGGAAWPDWFAAVFVLVAGLAFIGYGVLTMLGWPGFERSTAFGALSIAFGVLLSNDARSDVAGFRQPDSEPRWWWYYHLSRMTGSYVAALTAFSVQNLGPLLPAAQQWLVWVVPPLVGVLGINWWVGYYRRRFQRQVTAPQTH
jgi:uncharacterized membrane protein